MEEKTYTPMTDDEIEQYTKESIDRFVGAVERIATAMERWATAAEASAEIGRQALEMNKSLIAEH